MNLLSPTLYCSIAGLSAGTCCSLDHAQKRRQEETCLQKLAHVLLSHAFRHTSNPTPSWQSSHACGSSGRSFLEAASISR